MRRRLHLIVSSSAALTLLTALLFTCRAEAIGQEPASPERVDRPIATVKKCEDFEVDGKGSAAAWQTTEWIRMNQRSGPADYQTRFKLLYSSTGIYVLFDGADSKLSATITEDFQDLWKEDVFECFFWTDERHPVYFEYEISPLGRELPILIPNLDGQFLGWRPWHYEGERRTRKAVSVRGGEAEPRAEAEGWRAEVFVPYALLKPLGNVPPKTGTKWRANFYRMDYDQQPATSWDWSRVGPSFHEYRRFGTLVFQ